MPCIKLRFLMLSRSLYVFMTVLLIAAAGCTGAAIKLQTDGIGQKEGILVAGTFDGRRMLWFTSGISVKVGQGEAVKIPWAESHFISLPAGSHAFEIWHGQRASVARGCFKLNQGQVLYLEYRPGEHAGEGRVDVLDLNSRRKIDLKKCELPECPECSAGRSESRRSGQR